MLALFAQVLMHHDANAQCGAQFRGRSDERVNQRNGYRTRRWDTRAGTIDLNIPKLRRGSYYLDWLLEPRRRAEKALQQVIVEAYVKGVSTRSGRNCSQCSTPLPKSWAYLQTCSHNPRGGATCRLREGSLPSSRSKITTIASSNSLAFFVEATV